MTHEEFFQKVIAKAVEFGFNPKNLDRQENPRGDSIIRKNLGEEALKSGGAYFGLIRPEQDLAGPYADFSFVVFPDKDLTAVVVGLVVGSAGFQSDYELAAMPGLRRQFVKLFRDSDKSYFKDDFSDADSTFTRLRNNIRREYPTLAASVEAYKTVIVACEIVDIEPEAEETALHRVYSWLATYARARETGSNKEQRTRQKEYLPAEPPAANELDDVRHLLQSRRYVVLQGAPGTGKTFTARRLAQEYDKVFFDQFHAETTYSDFVGGLLPATDADAVGDFERHDGLLTRAVKYAAAHPAEKVLMIVDEINRANLANVLGPVFYLFEPMRHNLTDRKGATANFEIDLNGTLLESLPDNLYVLATMNTADRSLAVVDFALRRRFAWYTLHPRILSRRELAGHSFDSAFFAQMDEIFMRHATDAELSLQPGHSYFIYDPDKPSLRAERIRYELMPLIKEYLAQGYLEKARTDFAELFLAEGCRMYE